MSLSSCAESSFIDKLTSLDLLNQRTCKTQGVQSPLPIRKARGHRSQLVSSIPNRRLLPLRGAKASTAKQSQLMARELVLYCKSLPSAARAATQFISIARIPKQGPHPGAALQWLPSLRTWEKSPTGTFRMNLQPPFPFVPDHPSAPFLNATLRAIKSMLPPTPPHPLPYALTQPVERVRRTALRHPPWGQRASGDGRPPPPRPGPRAGNERPLPL